MLLDDIVFYCSDVPRHFNEIYMYLRLKGYTISKRRLAKILVQLVKEGKLRELQCRFFHVDYVPLTIIHERLRELKTKCLRPLSEVLL